MKTAILAVLASALLASAAHARTEYTTKPGPFRGWTQTTVKRDQGGRTRTEYCTTKPGPFRGQTTTTCR